MGSCGWLVEKIYDEIKGNADVPILHLQSLVLEKYGVLVKRRLMYKARTTAREVLEGAFDESYGLIPAYMEVLKSTNPSSVCHYASTKHGDKEEFKYCFISFKCMFEGFTRGCRPFIGVDGFHMKGSYGGVVLLAIAFDANHQLFPIAYGIAHVEKIGSGTYFLKMLKSSIPNVEEYALTFISDRQKGVERALGDVFPRSSKRHCYRVLFWQATNAKTTFVFEKTMKSIKTHSAAAYQYLMDIPLESWATFKFHTVVCCKENIPNFVESFNSTLGLDRNKPILSLLEGIRRACLIRIGTR